MRLCRQRALPLTDQADDEPDEAERSRADAMPRTRPDDEEQDDDEEEERGRALIDAPEPRCPKCHSDDIDVKHWPRTPAEDPRGESRGRATCRACGHDIELSYVPKAKG